MPRTQRARDAKREKILAGAIRAFAAKGFHRTRVSEVAKAAGVADGTIYLYFAGKNDLLAAVFEEAMERFGRRSEERMAQSEDPREQLRALIELHLESLGEDRDLAIVFQVDLRHSLQFMGEVSRATLGAYLRTIAGIIARGQSAGVFDADLPPLDLAKMVFGVLDEMATNWVLSARNYRLESMLEPACAFVFRGLGRGTGA